MCECVKEDCRECGNKLSNQMAERPDGWVAALLVSSLKCCQKVLHVNVQSVYADVSTGLCKTMTIDGLQFARITKTGVNSRRMSVGVCLPMNNRFPFVGFIRENEMKIPTKRNGRYSLKSWWMLVMWILYITCPWTSETNKFFS